jgi:CHASE3 domain sensor protein
MIDRKLDATAQIETLQRDLRDHAKTLTEIISAQTTLSGRVQMLEQAQGERMVLEARQEERAIARIEWQERIEKEVNSLRGVGVKLLWIIATGIIGAFIVFMVNGGMATP